MNATSTGSPQLTRWQPKKRFGLLDLAPELRNLIYEKLLDFGYIELDPKSATDVCNWKAYRRHRDFIRTEV